MRPRRPPVARVRSPLSVFAHHGVPSVLNVQSGKSGKAKPYQVRQFLKEVERFELPLKADR